MSNSTRKIGDMLLRVGDTLLIEARPDFIARQGRSRDFLLVSEVGGFHPPNHKGAPAALAITIMVAASADFATPIGYQTNLMVYNAEGYRFSCYVPPLHRLSPLRNPTVRQDLAWNIPL